MFAVPNVKEHRSVTISQWLVLMGNMLTCSCETLMVLLDDRKYWV